MFEGIAKTFEYQTFLFCKPFNYIVGFIWQM